MATTTNKTVRLTFTTSAGKAFSLNIPNPRQDLTAAEAMDVMNGLITSGIFSTASGSLSSVKDLKVIDTTIDDLYDPPQA